MTKITLHETRTNGRVEICPEDIRSRCEADFGTRLVISPSEQFSYGITVVEDFDEIDALIAKASHE